MLSDAERNEAAEMLLQAERDCSPERQLSTTWPASTRADVAAVNLR